MESQSPSYDHKESLLPPTEQEELNALRKDQLNGNDWTEEKRRRLMELSAKEETARTEKYKK